MFTTLLEKLEADKKAEIDRINKEYEEKIKDAKKFDSANSALLELAKTNGFESAKPFLKFLGYLKAETSNKPEVSASTDEKNPRKKRVVVSDEMKLQIQSLLGSKEKASKIAGQFGISVGTVYGIKKDAGLN